MRATAAALRDAAARLAGVSDTPRLDAELLLAHALGITREALLTSPPLSRLRADGGRESFDELVARRLAHEPVAYITGRRAFWTIELAVTGDVLIPRPDSETLIEAAVARFGGDGPARVLDLGTGSGALLLAALDQWPAATGLGIDVSPAALAVARANGARIAPERAEFRRGDWTDGIGEAFDLVLCNPPYIATAARLPRDVAAWEPAGALYAGADGLAAYRALAPRIGGVLRPTGVACVEIGAGQATSARALFEHAGLKVAERRDLGGHVRCLTMRH